jgi:hypothetical protein
VENPAMGRQIGLIVAENGLKRRIFAKAGARSLVNTRT